MIKGHRVWNREKIWIYENQVMKGFKTRRFNWSSIKGFRVRNRENYKIIIKSSRGSNQDDYEIIIKDFWTILKDYGKIQSLLE